MTPDQIKLVQDSFAKVAPMSEQAAILFYDRLFEVAPQVKAMFPADLTEQRKKLMATLAVVVTGLSNLESILPAASALASRHVAYGARPEHYPVVGGALLWTLEKGLGDEILAAYDRTSKAVDKELAQLRALDPNMGISDPMKYSLAALGGGKLDFARAREALKQTISGAGWTFHLEGGRAP